MDLPLELLEQYDKERVLVFVGQGINGKEWTRLGHGLADRLGAERASGLQTTEEITELYESFYGRQALVQFVLDFYSQAVAQNKAHNLLARLSNCRLFVTTCVDERLEEAFRADGRPLQSIIRPSDLAYSSAKIARLYRLYGTLSQPESLRLTQEQAADALTSVQEGGVSDVLKGHLADSTIVFVGFNLDDGFFKQLYRSSIQPLHRHHPRSYAFADQSYTELTRRFCERNNIEILEASLADILSAFIEALKGRLPKVPLTIVPPKSDLKDAFRQQPFKRLISYKPEDSSLFFGRRQETEQLLSLIQANQIVLLCGDSGAGKSSILGAGVVPILEESEYIVVQERALEPPLTALQRHLKSMVSGESEDNSMIGLLIAATKKQPLVIIFDQFEEFFIGLETTERETFISELANIVSRRDLVIKWVFAVRSEYLARFNEFRKAIPDIFKAEFYLTSLSMDAAKEAICGPLEKVGLGIEAELLQKLLADLGLEGWIDPPQLQIVCHDVYQTALAKEDNVLRLDYYTERGGAWEILGNYLKQALRRLPSPQDRQAKQVMVALLTSEGTPAVLSVNDIAEAAKLAIDQTSDLLARLQDERLVKTVMREDQLVYELAHAYVAASIVVDSDVLQRKAIEELLRRNIQDWQRYRILLSEDELQTLRDWIGKIGLSLDAKNLLARSVIQRADDLSYWLEWIDPDIIQPILKEYFTGSETVNAQPELALAALSYVSDREAFVDDLCSLLQSPSLSTRTRQQAAIYLAQLKPTLAVQTLRQAPAHLQPESQKALVYLYNAHAIGTVTLNQPPTWTERKSILSSRLRTNIGYMAARTGTAGLAAVAGGLLGSLAGLGIISGYYFLYLFGAAFIPFIWAASLTLGLSFVETLRFNQQFSTMLFGAILGSLPMALIAAADPDPNLARTGLIYGLFAAVLSGIIFATTLTFSSRLANTRWRVVLLMGGAALAGLISGLILAPVATMTGVSGFNQWILAAILAGGGASMMLGLILVPSLPFRTTDQKDNLDLTDFFYTKEAQHVTSS